MLLLAIALHAATAGTPVARPAAQITRVHSARRAHHRRKRVAALRFNVLAPACRQNAACRDPGTRYRLPLRETEVIDFKTRVVEKGKEAPCGTTGSSICTSKGTPVVRAPLGDD